MSGELKSENINMEKAPLEEAIIQQKDYSTVPLNTTTFQKDIIQRTQDTFPLWDFKGPEDWGTLTDCSSLVNAIQQWPWPLPEINRRV
jgi:hypothetical protein